MRYIFLTILVAFLFASLSYAIEVGDPVFDVNFGVKDGKVVKFRTIKEKYRKTMTDEKFRSSLQTNTRIAIIDKSGKILDSAYFELMERQSELDVSEEDAKRLPRYFGMAVFKADPSAYKIQVFYKKKLGAERLVSSIE